MTSGETFFARCVGSALRDVFGAEVAISWDGNKIASADDNAEPLRSDLTKSIADEILKEKSLDKATAL
jgi:hypothetical protein